MQLSTLESVGFAPDFHTQVVKKGKQLVFRVYDISYTIDGDVVVIAGTGQGQK